MPLGAQRNNARHHIATYKSPEQVVFLDEMPTNSTGKMDRARMKQMARDEV